MIKKEHPDSTAEHKTHSHHRPPMGAVEL